MYKKTIRACYVGYITQAIVVNLAPLLFAVFHSKFNISFEKIGTLIFINFITQLLVDFISVKFIDRMGYRIPAVLAHLFSAVGLILMGTLPIIFPENAYVEFVISSVIYAIGGGLIEVIISPIVDSVIEEKGSGAMSLLHSFYCWGQALTILLSTVVLVLVSDKHWWILPLMWSLIPFVNMFVFMKVPLKDTIPQEKKTPVRKLFHSGMFICMILIMICAGASELIISQWVSLFAETGLGVAKVVGDLVGPCLFAIFMGIGRTIYGVWGAKIKLAKALFLCAVLCVVCYITAAFSSVPYIALLACALCGFAVSIMWPGTISLCASEFPLGGVAMFSILALAGDIGCSVGPYITGQISDYFSVFLSSDMALKYGIASGVVFPIILITVLLIYGRLVWHENNTSESK